MYKFCASAPLFPTYFWIFYSFCALLLSFSDGSMAYPYELIKQANSIMRDGDLITRTTIQIEPYDEYSARSCKQCLHPAPTSPPAPKANNII